MSLILAVRQTAKKIIGVTGYLPEKFRGKASMAPCTWLCHSRVCNPMLLNKGPPKKGGKRVFAQIGIYCFFGELS